MRHLLEITDLTPRELEDVLDDATGAAPAQVLAGRGVALVFEKPSARTRNATEMAVVQLGGHPVTIRGEDIGLDDRESVEDVTRTLACYHSAVAARVFRHETLERMAAVDGVPIVNLLSERAHPMQALADMLTLRQEFGELHGRTLAWVGDANNVCRSLVLAASALGMCVRMASPPGYGFSERELASLATRGARPVQVPTAGEAARGAHAVVTDTWVSMGQEQEAEHRRARFAGFTVDESVMAGAEPEAVFLHCLPAHRGLEVSAEVIDGPRSRVWQQAANRMHTARALIAWLLAAGDR